MRALSAVGSTPRFGPARRLDGLRHIVLCARIELNQIELEVSKPVPQRYLAQDIGSIRSLCHYS